MPVRLCSQGMLRIPPPYPCHPSLQLPSSCFSASSNQMQEILMYTKTEQVLNNAKEEMSYHGLWKGLADTYFIWGFYLLFLGGKMETERKREVSLCVVFFRNVPTKAVVGTDGSFQEEGCSWRVLCLEAPNLQRCSWSVAHRKICGRCRSLYIEDATGHCQPLASSPRWAQPGSAGICSSPKSRSISLCSTEGNGAEVF